MSAMRTSYSTSRDVNLEIHERDVVAGLEKGLAVIEAFDATRTRLSLAEVAKTTGMTRAAARRYLLTLVKNGYAAFDGKFFSLTPRVLRLGYAYLSSTAVAFRVQPIFSSEYRKRRANQAPRPSSKGRRLSMSPAR